MSNLTSYVFNNQPVSVLFDGENNPWFKGKDVAEILMYSDTNKAIRNNVDEDDKINIEKLIPIQQAGLGFDEKLIYDKINIDKLNPVQQTGLRSNEKINPLQQTRLRGNKKSAIFINESGLYSLILSSKKPEARAFKKWITSEVLPAIRKHGEYKVISEIQALKNENSKLSQLFLKATENNQQLAIVNSKLEATNQALSKRVVKVLKNTGLNHVFCVLKKEELLDKYNVVEYKCIRTEKRSFNRALKKAKEQGFTMCFFKENVPNSISILNNAKEIMYNYGMHFDSAYNSLVTSYDFINIVERVLDE